MQDATDQTLPRSRLAENQRARVVDIGERVDERADFTHLWGVTDQGGCLVAGITSRIVINSTDVLRQAGADPRKALIRREDFADTELGEMDLFVNRQVPALTNDADIIGGLGHRDEKLSRGKLRRIQIDKDHGGGRCRAWRSRRVDPCEAIGTIRVGGLHHPASIATRDVTINHNLVCPTCRHVFMYRTGRQELNGCG